MARPKSLAPPKYRLHKARNLAVVTIDGLDYYLGRYGTPESHEMYARLVAERHLPRQEQAAPTSVSSTLNDAGCVAIGDLSLAYWNHLSRSGGLGSREHTFRAALKALNDCYASCPLENFGPLKLQAVRQSLVDRELSRRYINDLIRILVRMFRWAVSQEMIRPEIHLALAAVDPLKARQSSAREPRRIRPVALDVVEATIAHLPPAVAAMVRLQLLTGARPGEICALRPCNISVEADGIWCYRPDSHKNEHRGHERRIYIGPRGQQVLGPWLERDTDAYCFSPQESEKMRRAGRAEAGTRRRNRCPSKPRSPRRPPGLRYNKDSYARAVKRACQQAGVSTWTPHQLRHTSGTLIRERYGIERAQTVLGHHDPAVTEIYAERNFAAAASAMLDMG